MKLGVGSKFVIFLTYISIAIISNLLIVCQSFSRYFFDIFFFATLNKCLKKVKGNKTHYHIPRKNKNNEKEAFPLQFSFCLSILFMVF